MAIWSFLIKRLWSAHSRIMSDSIQHISLLYELSVTTLKYLNPGETAKHFIKKLLSRKNLNYGAIWRIDHMDEEYITFTLEYAMPTAVQRMRCSLESYSETFADSPFFHSQHPIFDVQHLDGNGYYLYYKLGDIGILELFSRNDPEKVSISSFYKFRDVFNQCACSTLQSANLPRVITLSFG